VKAAVVHGPGDLRVEEVTDSWAGPGEVQLRVEAALTCATDVKTVQRGHPAAPPAPFVLGHEFAGIVASVGQGVTAFRQGERVVAVNSAPCGICRACRRDEPWVCAARTYLVGGFAEFIIIPAPIVGMNAHHVPSTLSLEVAALTEPLACAALAVERASVRAGDIAAVLGAGPMGLMVTALLVDRGVRVIVIDPHPERLDLAHRFGAERGLLGKRSAADVPALRRCTPEDAGADHVFEAIGRPESWELAVAMVRPGGAAHLFGGCPRGTSIQVSTELIHYDQVRIDASYHHTPATVTRALETLVAARWPWDVLLGPRIDLDGLPEVLLGLTSPSARPPKYVVLPGVGRGRPSLAAGDLQEGLGGLPVGH
jgi:L-iditol 2-dehydrogenase